MNSPNIESAENSDRHSEIQRQRSVDATWAVVSGIGTAELLFASFAIGTSLGPAPLRPLEVLVLSTLVFILGGVASLIISKKRHEKGARHVVRVDEGRKHTRIVVFEDYFTIGNEVVLKADVRSASLEDQKLVLRYKDPRFEGAVLRELSGARADLAGLRERLDLREHTT